MAVLKKLDALRAVPFFRGLDDAALEAVFERSVERVYEKGETLFLEGEQPKGLFVVWRGAVKVFKIGPSGREQILEVEGPGRSVAELPLFDGLPYPASCSAVQDSVVLSVNASEFHRLLDSQPAITRAIIASLSERLRYMVHLVEEISLKDVRARLVDLLLREAGESDRVELGGTHHEIAARIGTVREIVSRTLGRMAQDGVIRVEGRTVQILDRERLRS